MNKFTRKQINLKPMLHNREYVTVEDTESALMHLMKAAVKAGADEDKMMEYMTDEPPRNNTVKNVCAQALDDMENTSMFGVND